MDFVPTLSVTSAFIGRGIYRLYRQSHNDLEVVYVGQAKCISARIHIHHSDGVKSFSHFDYILLPDLSKAELDIAEACEIFRLAPLYNMTLPPTGRHRRLAQIAYSLKTRPAKLQRYITEKGIKSFLGKYDANEFVGFFDEPLL